MKFIVLIFWGFLCAILGSFLHSPLVSAQAFCVPEDTNYSIRFLCEINDAVCTGNAVCNISITYPNSSSLAQAQAADLIGDSTYEYNLTANDTGTKGDHQARIRCFDGSLNGSSSFIYHVNPTGICSTEQKNDSMNVSIGFMFGIGIILFVGFLFVKNKPPVKWTFFMFSIIFFLIGINLILVSLQDEVVNPRIEGFFDGFTVISFIFYWFAAGLLIIMWFFTMLNTWIQKKNMNNLRKQGLA